MRDSAQVILFAAWRHAQLAAERGQAWAEGLRRDLAAGRIHSQQADWWREKAAVQEQAVPRLLAAAAEMRSQLTQWTPDQLEVAVTLHDEWLAGSGHAGDFDACLRQAEISLDVAVTA